MISDNHLPTYGRTLLATALATAIVLGCAARSSYDLFTIPANEFYAKTKTIVLASVSLPGEVAAPERVIAEIESLIANKLSEAGFATVPSRKYGEIWSRLTEQAGGFFDPFTGEQDEVRFQDAVEQLHQELAEKFDPDALLYPEIWDVEAPVSSGVAKWDGTSQTIAGPGFPLSMEGTVLALSLVIVIEDMDGVELYFNGAGIEVLEKWDLKTRDLAFVPQAELFADGERILKAVNTALAPLIEARPAVPCDTLCCCNAELSCPDGAAVSVNAGVLSVPQGTSH